MDPKVLVISNNCFSKSDSNGRTLGNFFMGWQKECLAQFYIQNVEPDFEYCNNYFRVTDGQALNALKGKPCVGGIVLENKNIEKSNAKKDQKQVVVSAKPARNALTMMGRNFIWQTGKWKNCGFEQWVNDFNPDIVLLQAGDCAFMFRLAVQVAKNQNAKLVIYNSEGYYFKDFDYFKSNGIAKHMYHIFHKDLKKALKKSYNEAKYIIYSCDELKEAYGKEFYTNSETIYTVSEINPRCKRNIHEGFKVSYCGNLGLNRHKGLIEIAQVLQEISSDLYVDVYGKIPNQQVKNDFEKCQGIRYHGLVPYDQVKEILYCSDLLLHVESFDEFYQEDLKFAFSTKIADSLSSGTCFLLYAPEKLACSKYLIANEVAYVVSDCKKLKSVLELLVGSEKARKRYLSRAIELAEQNHRCEKNIQKFQNILRKL